MSDQTPLIAAPKKRGRLYAVIAAAVVVVIGIVIAVFAIGANSGNANDAAADGIGSNAITEGKGSAGDPVKIGVVGAQ